MVKMALQITCRLDNVEELRPCESGFRWCLKFNCGNCGESSDKWNCPCADEPIPAQRGSGVNHFVCKCKLCSRENSMAIIEDSVQPFTARDQGEFKTIVVFDCRGLEPSDFAAREGWTVEAANGGTEFNNVDLTEGEWEDYCDKIKEPIGIYDIQHRFKRIK
ncbi:PREDICTED: UPF0587 protein C1orf123 homolog [Vollenhovia emeryi]|uniref:UPF0587 protein C1orf123 homolog n=1 Tax=Vollenhovia emeryi TaxID=411798 RepID=UPI0005F55A1F|nr:PREDICTED: UPF0587 protein C1orf123 homolog [Vollenhovia emeryi]XP_011869452.1 PREDICTED: UPF0587 protein C1orf123 homolog [Vollenhovia emeryi]